jgi:Transglycosylase-like domain
MRPLRALHPRAWLLAAALLLPTLLWAGSPVPSQGSDASSLQREIDAHRSTEQRSRSAADRLARLEQQASRSVDLLQRRLDALQADAAVWQQRLANTEAEQRHARDHALALRHRLTRDRDLLAETLRSGYMSTPPDMVAVVLGSTSFANLVERATFLRRAQQRNASVIAAVRDARAQTRRQARQLAGLVPRQRAATQAAQRERNAAAQVEGALEARRATLAQARDARLAVARGAAAGRHHAETELRRLEAQQRQAISQTGPGGPWAIPWAIVQCESGGQNLPPNGAGASGYYQFLPSTWSGLGGSTPAAYLASKAEQDRLAARLWAGGAGASNWVCAGIVGIT